MDKKNGLVILGLLLVIAVIAAIGFFGSKRGGTPVISVTDPDGATLTITTDAPADTAEPTGAVLTAAPSSTPASGGVPRAWLLVTVDNRTYAPYALTKAGDYTIQQKEKGATNVIHVTEDSVQMASSTCENQLCVSQGVVTLENKATRILGNYIICLPNGVTLELLDAAEYGALLQQWATEAP